MFFSDSISKFIEEIRKLPNISKKQAEKIVLWVLQSPDSDVLRVANSFKRLKEKVHFCNFCQSPSEIEYCKYCDNAQRENKLLLVENFTIIDKIENAGFYKGKYYTFKNILKKESDVDKTMFEINSLKEYAQSFDEVILGISPTLHGEMTNVLIKKELSKIGINVSQLAIGVPIGASMDYIDEMTLKFSLIHRQK
ncbi:MULTISPECIES: toprim domain-containing protein [unclassified Mycoplasma]|uniref:toprim domain-containing protein n=1 Tax=unclassified Mycoplasma TaxID=2683645 RepID=UPI00211C6E80|nr:MULTISPECIES: toprim domain-containing protein [unclassified Mycoplasma]UUM19717.1 toprim domain-containing protein [Mycoplasma sp. 1578d]UUM24700.1 toprim domain-containing protein [Mycoplasma sp. 3686d]